MRETVKLVSGLVVAGAVGLLLIARSGDVAGDPSLPDEPAAAPDPNTGDPDPSVQYELGPGKILYEEQTSEEQANLDRMAEVTEASQDARSNESMARAASQAAEQARAEIAARHVGLTGTGAGAFVSTSWSSDRASRGLPRATAWSSAA